MGTFSKFFIKTNVTDVGERKPLLSPVFLDLQPFTLERNMIEEQVHTTVT